MQRSRVAMQIDSQNSCTGSWYAAAYRESQVYQYGQAGTVEVAWASSPVPLYVRTGWRMRSRHSFTPMPGATGGGYFELDHSKCA